MFKYADKINPNIKNGATLLLINILANNAKPKAGRIPAATEIQSITNCGITDRNASTAGATNP